MIEITRVLKQQCKSKENMVERPTKRLERCKDYILASWSSIRFKEYLNQIY